MNWGAKLFTALGIFVVGMVAVGTYMVSSDSDSLIDDQYYEQGLNYDQKIQKKQNAENFGAIPSVQIKGDSLLMIFKEKNNKGNVAFIRPSDQKLDFSFPFDLTGDSLQISISSLEKGNWQMELDWNAKGREYFHEQRVTF